MSVNGSLGMSIRAMRRMKKMTQGELAKRTGLSASSITGIETGRQIVTQANLNAIADALGYTVFVTFRRKEGRATGGVAIDKAGI